MAAKFAPIQVFKEDKARLIELQGDEEGAPSIASVVHTLLASVDDAECLVVIKDGELVSKLDKMTENLKKSGKKIETEEDLFNCMVDIINENIDFDESTEEN